VNCDDTVWLADGEPGIVIGLGDGKVAILWPNGNVTKHKPKEIVHNVSAP